MPGHKTHTKIAFISAPVVGWGAWAFQNGMSRVLEEIGQRPESYRMDNAPAIIGRSLLIAAGSVFGGTMGSPDLDIPSAPYNSWGPLRILWLPWQVMVRHRSPASHWPMLATMLKAIYINLVLILLALLVSLFWDVSVWTFFHLMGWEHTHGLLVLWMAKLVWTVVKSPLYWLFLTGDIIGMALHDATDFLDGQRRRHHQKEMPPLEDPDDEREKSYRDRHRRYYD